MIKNLYFLDNLYWLKGSCDAVHDDEDDAVLPAAANDDDGQVGRRDAQMKCQLINV